MTDLEISLIRTDGGTQPRAGLSPDVIEEYAEAMREGAQFPPVTIFYDGESHWLSDGFHRLEAAEQIVTLTIAADIHQGTRRDAVLHSVGVNAEHGLRRSPADKRRAVETLLRDTEWSQWSDNAIAKACKVDHKTVTRIRTDLGIPKSNIRTGLDSRTVNTTNIGKKPTSDSSPGSKLEKHEEEAIYRPDQRTISITAETVEEESAPAAEKINEEKSINGRSGVDSAWEEATKDLPREDKAGSELPLQIGDRVKSIYQDRFGTVIKIQGGLVSTQWEDGFTSTERRGEIQPVPPAPTAVDQSQPQVELDENPVESLQRCSEARARFRLSWYGREVEVEGQISALMIDWEYEGRKGQTQVPIDQVVSILAGDKA